MVVVVIGLLAGLVPLTPVEMLLPMSGDVLIEIPGGPGGPVTVVETVA